MRAWRRLSATEVPLCGYRPLDCEGAVNARSLWLRLREWCLMMAEFTRGSTRRAHLSVDDDSGCASRSDLEVVSRGVAHARRSSARDLPRDPETARATARIIHSNPFTQTFS